MTFPDFVSQWCDQLPGADGDTASFIADRYLRLSGQVSDPTTQRRLIDSAMRGVTYFQPGYCGLCALKLRAYARA